MLYGWGEENVFEQLKYKFRKNFFDNISNVVVLQILHL
jgi:hypothetical protein